MRYYAQLCGDDKVDNFSLHAELLEDVKEPFKRGDSFELELSLPNGIMSFTFFVDLLKTVGPRLSICADFEELPGITALTTILWDREARQKELVRKFNGLPRFDEPLLREDINVFPKSLTTIEQTKPSPVFTEAEKERLVEAFVLGERHYRKDARYEPSGEEIGDFLVWALLTRQACLMVQAVLDGTAIVSGVNDSDEEYCFYDVAPQGSDGFNQ